MKPPPPLSLRLRLATSKPLPQEPAAKRREGARQAPLFSWFAAAHLMEEMVLARRKPRPLPRTPGPPQLRRAERQNLAPLLQDPPR